MKYVVYFVDNSSTLYVEKGCKLTVEDDCFYFIKDNNILYVIPIAHVKYMKTEK